MGRIAAETAVFLIGEIKESLILQNIVIARRIGEFVNRSTVSICLSINPRDEFSIVIGIDDYFAGGVSENRSEFGMLCEIQFVFIGKHGNINGNR